ncbi:MAG TPA: hypothetical protein VGQ83_41565 [Polyangia bacterium]
MIRRIECTALLVLTLAAVAPPARAQTALFIESESILAGRRWAPSFSHEADAAQCRLNADLSDYCKRLLVPFYEYLTVRADNLGVPGLSIEFAGWGVADFADRFDPTHAARVPRYNDTYAWAHGGVGGDIMVGTIAYRGLGDKLELRLGRQFLFTGAPYATNLDGAYIRYRLPWSFDVAVYGGGSTPRDAEAGRDAYNGLYGGRVGWSQLDRGSLGVSVLNEVDGDGDVVRRQLGVDGSVLLPKHVDVAGAALWDLVEKNIDEVMLTASWMPLPRLKLAADYTYMVPSAMIPKTSIFSIFSDATYQDAGLDVYYRLMPKLRVSGLFRARFFSEGNNGWLWGVGGKYLIGDRLREVVGLDFMRLASKDTDLRDNGYYQVRGYGAVAPLPRFLLTADLFYFHFDNTVYNGNTVRNAGSVNASASYRITDRMDALVSLIANFNPASKEEVILLGRFVWHTWLEPGARRVSQ